MGAHIYRVSTEAGSKLGKEEAVGGFPVEVARNGG